LIAAAVTKGKVLVRDVTSEGIKDPSVIQFAERVTWVHDNQFNAENKIGPAKVKIELKNGQFYTKQLEVAYGHPRNPISWEDLKDKFRDCASYSITPLSKEKIETVIDLLNNLEQIDDMKYITGLLS
jgi:2-methylcitrate dehydratase